MKANGERVILVLPRNTNVSDTISASDALLGVEVVSAI